MSFVKFQAAEPSTPPAGTQIAVDDVGGDVFQRVKVDIGADGISSPVTAANPMPISDAGGSVTVDGPLTNAELRAANIAIAIPGAVSANNSSTTPLAGGATFAGTADDILNFAVVIVSAHSDKASATNGLKIFFSSDAIHWDESDAFTLAANGFKTFTFQPVNRYFKLTYTNGASAQSELHLSTQFRSVPVKASSHRLADDISGQDDAELMKAVLAAEKPNGIYTNINATTGGNLKISIEEIDSAVNPMPVDIPATSVTKDAFGRLRVSGLIKQAYGAFEYGINPFFIESQVVGTGAVTSNTNESAIVLRTGGTAQGALARAQTRAFQRYTPGNSKLARITGSFAAPTAGVRQRCGRFSNTDGLFLEWDGTSLFFVRRTSTSGSIVDTRTARADWFDQFDGTGPSGLTIDFESSLSWLSWMDLEWLGVGRYRLGFASPVDGGLVPAVIGAGTNQLEVPYIRTANLPTRFEIENTGATGADLSLRWYCYSDDDEGAEEADIPLQFPVDSGVTPQTLANGTFKPILALRAKTAGPNSVANRAQIIIKAVQAVVSGNQLSLFRIILNPTTLTANGGAVTWASASALAEFAAFSAAGDTVDGGTIIGDSFYVPASVQVKGGGDAKLFRRFPLVYTELGSVQDTIVLVGAGVGATSAALGEISYQEIY